MIPKLKDYQRVATDFMKDVNRSGLFLDVGLGKSCDNNTPLFKVVKDKPVLTTVGEIKVGDYLYDRKGQPTEVLAVYPQGKVKAFKVTLKDGRSFVACDEHLVPYYSYTQAKTISNKPLGEMIDDFKRTNKKNHTTYKYRIPMNEAVEFPKNDHIIDPYVLGILIGDGLMRDTSLAISNNEIDIVHKIADLMNIPHENIHKNKNNYTWSFTNHENADIVRDELTRLGLRGLNSHDKFIPDDYLYDSIENRMRLIKGLIDSDGHVKITHHGSLHYSYSTMNMDLAKQIQQLCLSLGFGVNINDYIYNNKRHDISIRIYTPEIIVTSEKHLKNIARGEYRSTYHDMTPIVDIKEVEPREMTCFTVDNDEHLFLINDYIVTHNTLTTLTALVELGQEGRLHGHVLVVAPKRVAMNTWSDEIEKWGHTRNARYVILAGLTKKKREEIYDSIPTAPPTIYIINRELIPNLVDRFPAEKWQFLNVILDEAQSFKNYASVGFKKLKSIAPYTHRFVLLTGTPAPNGLMEIWSLIYLLDGGQRLGPNITNYRETHFYPGRRTPQGYPYEWHLMEGHDEVIKNEIKDIVVGMEKEDYLDIPPITHNVIELHMTDKEYKVYRQLRREQVLPLMDGTNIESANAAVLSGKLLQLSNGAIYADEEKSEVIELHKHKLHALEEIIDGSNGHPILCFYWFKHDRARLENHFPEGRTFDGSNVMLKAWNNKEIPLMFVQPQSAGHGLNLQHGSHIMVFFSIPWSFELYGQAIGRLHRTGQEKQVIIHYLKMKGTVEDKIIKRLIDKQFDHKDLMDAIRAEVADV